MPAVRPYLRVLGAVSGREHHKLGSEPMCNEVH